MTAPPPVRVPDDARWSCRSCGACCRGFEFGPVEPHVIAGLQQRQIEDHWAPAAEGPWFEERGGAFFLAHRDGHCVFLRSDNLCAVHGLFGADAKPAFCREYPLHVVQDPRGLVVVARADCGGFHESFADGQPVAEQVPEVLDLPQLHPRRTFQPDSVVILPDAAVSLDNYMDIEPLLLDELTDRVAPRVGVARLRDRLLGLARRPAAEPVQKRYQMAEGAVFSALRYTFEHALQGDAHHPAADPTDPRAILVRTVHDALQRPRTSAPELTDDAIDYLHLVLRSELLAKQFTIVGGLPFGLGLHLLGVDLATRGLSGPASAADIGPTLSAFKRLCANQMVLHVLQTGRPALADLFLHA